MKALSTLFNETEENFVMVNGEKVFGIDSIPLRKGTVTIEFLSEPAGRPMGVALKTPNGRINLTPDEDTTKLYTWNLPDLPKKVSYQAVTKDGILKLWNIYTINEFDPTRAEYWTNNAGMVIENIHDRKRCYYCSSGDGEFDKTNIVFTIEWNEEGRE